MNTIKQIIKDLSRKIGGIIQRLLRIPWVTFVFHIGEELGKYDAGDMAAAIAYYSILSVFPLLLGTIAVLGIFLPSETIQTYIFDFSKQYVPGSLEVIQENITSVIKLRGALGVISVIGLFWTGSAIFEAIGRAINTVWDIQAQRAFFIRKARILLMTLSIGVLFLFSMAANAFSSIIPMLNLPLTNSLSILIARTAGFLLLFIVFVMLFKYVPNKKISWRFIWPGAIVTTILFELARSVFIYYLSNFAGYNMVYGSLAVVIILLVWIYFSAFIFIIGAEFTIQFAKIHNKGQ